MIAYNGTFPGESSVPVCYYVDMVLMTSSAPPMTNDRVDGWGTSFPTELVPFFTNEEYEVGRSYPKGTILIWDQPHIAIVVSSDGSDTVEVFEQNADPDGSVCGLKSRVLDDQQRICTYALVPITTTPGNMQTPAPAYSLPAGALRIPTKMRKYYICKTILGFSAYSRAASHTAAVGTVRQGNWYIFKQTNGMINVTKTPGQSGYWINPADNTAEVER